MSYRECIHGIEETRCGLCKSDNREDYIKLEGELHKASERIEQLETELERLQSVVGEEDYDIISALLTPDGTEHSEGDQS